MKFWRANPAVRHKADGSPVSEADEAVDATMQALLRSPYPEIAWLSEESAEAADVRGVKPLAWIVDPIDGTRPFLSGSEEFCIAACLCNAGAPVAAAVFCPPRQELFAAAHGRAATLNGRTVSVRDTSSLSDAVILAGRSLFNAAPPPRWRPNPAMCLAFAEVAAGRADAVAAKGMKSDWDIAAGALLVQEAGGRATCLDGSPFRFNQDGTRQPGLIAAGPRLHALLRTALAS